MDDNGTVMTMPVAPAYGAGYGNSGFGFGGDWAWIIILLLACGGGFGFGGGFGGYGMMNGMYEFPWLLNGQNSINANTNAGFRDAMLNDGITSIRDGISGLSTQLCGCCGDMQMSLANGFANVEQGANARQMANMQQAFNAQTATMQGFNGVQGQLCGISSDIAREACATRTADTQNTQSVLNVINSGIQSIKDQLCQDKIDAKNDEIAQLRQEILYARGQASQVAQTAEIRTNNATVANQLIAEMRSCPIPSQPVYGNQPIFTCGGNGSTCGCNGNF